MTSTAKAASNGSTATTTATEPPLERVRGMRRVQESEVYHIATVAHDAAFEAECLCNDISRDVPGGYRSSGDSAQALGDPAMQAKIRDAIYCLTVAVDHLLSLAAGPLS